MPQVKMVPKAKLPSRLEIYDIRPAFDLVALELERLNQLDQVSIDSWCNRLAGRPLDQLPRIHAIEHRLAAQMGARNSPERFEPKSLHERAGVAGVRCALQEAITGHSEEFCYRVEHMHQLVMSDSEGLRHCGVRSKPDLLGNYVVFPPAATVRPSLQQLHAFLRENIERDRTLSATVAMVAICNIHPFTDGNGRLSRLLFNAIINFDREICPYIPLHELGRTSRGSLLIYMRLAQYRGEWSPIAGFLAESAKFLFGLKALPTDR